MRSGQDHKAVRVPTRRRSLSRGNFLRLGGAGLAGAALLGSGAVAGCGPPKDEGPTKLVFSHGEDTEILRRQISRFNRQHRGEVEVELRLAPADTGQYFEKLRTEFQSGETKADVISGDVIWPAQFAANGWISDVSDRFPESARQEFLPAPVQSLVYEGKIYGAPWFTDAGMLYYRADLLEKSGFAEPPATWDELKEMARKVTQDQGVKNGFVFQGANYEGGTVNGLEYIWTHGGDVLDGEKVIIDSPESVAGLETERSMIADGIATQAVSTYKEQENDGAFLGGETVFCRNWPYMYALAQDPEVSKIEPAQIGISPLPAGSESNSRQVSALGGWNMMINASSQKQEEAWEFVKWMTGEEGQRQRALAATLLPTRKALYEDEEILEKVPVIRLGKEALQRTKPRPVSPYYSDMSLKMAEQFNLSLKGATSPREAIQTLQKELTSIAEQAQ